MILNELVVEGKPGSAVIQRRLELRSSGGRVDLGCFFVEVGVRLFRMAVRTTGTAGLRAGAQGIVHNLPDGASTPAALRAAAQTAIDLIGRARNGVPSG